jgi:membrane-bound serine protease (ClpP class)
MVGKTRRLRIAHCMLRTLSVSVLLIAQTLLVGAQGGEHVDVITVEGIIDPMTAQYVDAAIEAAQHDGAQCLIIELDTPGGSDSSMRDIVHDMLGSTLPTVVYVFPAGARAGSAGLFITLAADISAMAPGTNIGAAHPVGLTGEITGTMGTKITNDAAAYARALAERRGRNAAWAEKAVFESVSLTAGEAVDSSVVDLTASDLTDLLQKIDGTTVPVAGGERSLATKGAAVRPLPMSAPQALMHAVVDPNIAYLLFAVGVLGLLAEFAHPGAIIPGVTGAIGLIVAFVAFGNLPVNWGGVALIALSVVLFILDIKVAGFALSVGGAMAFILGSLMLYNPLAPSSPTMPALSVSRPLIALMTGLVTAFFLFVVSAAVRAQRTHAVSGISTMVGTTGVATSDLNPEGTVQVKSELWTGIAKDGEIIQKGERVRVIAVRGVRLTVTKE